MKIQKFLDDIRGATALEFGITAPIFVMLVVGIVQAGLILWTQLGLQQGVEMGARCASVDAILCGTTSAIQNYAAQETYGVNPPPSTFVVATLSCGTQVSASYALPILSDYFDVATLHAQSCFPR
jgi:Flp pilus assembly protein TadG